MTGYAVLSVLAPLAVLVTGTACGLRELRRERVRLWRERPLRLRPLSRRELEKGR